MATKIVVIHEKKVDVSTEGLLGGKIARAIANANTRGTDALLHGEVSRYQKLLKSQRSKTRQEVLAIKEKPYTGEPEEATKEKPHANDVIGEAATNLDKFVDGVKLRLTRKY